MRGIALAILVGAAGIEYAIKNKKGGEVTGLLGFIALVCIAFGW